MIKILICSAIILSSRIFAQTNDEQFNSFFQNFKNAVNNNNVTEIAELTNFPFIWSWQGFNENPISKDSFMTAPQFPDYNLLSKAKLNKSVTIKQRKSEKETVNFIFKDDFYIISFDFYSNIDEAGGYSEYYFGLINGEYKYIKVISGD